MEEAEDMEKLQTKDSNAKPKQSPTESKQKEYVPRRFNKFQAARQEVKTTPLTIPHVEVLAIIERKRLPIEYPNEKPGTYLGNRQDLYCRFHKAKGHATDRCRQLKIAIEKLIQEGYLGEYAVQARETNKEDPRREKENTRDRVADGPLNDRQPRGKETMYIEGTEFPLINLIAGGTQNLEVASVAGKRNRDEIAKEDIGFSFLDKMTISFSEEDARGVRYPQDDALVVTAIVANHGVKRTLVDNGSAVNLLSLSAYTLMKRSHS